MITYRTGPETKRLNHRALTTDDAESFFALNSHPDVMKFTGEPPVTSVREAREAIAAYPDFDTVGYGRWACVLKDTQDDIGFCGLKYLADLDAVDVGYRFLPQYWGQGLATEACAASVEFGFETLKLRRIIGLVLPENVASLRVLEKVGMHRIENIMYEGQEAIQFEIRSSDSALKQVQPAGLYFAASPRPEYQRRHLIRVLPSAGRADSPAARVLADRKNLHGRGTDRRAGFKRPSGVCCTTRGEPRSPFRQKAATRPTGPLTIHDIAAVQ